MDFCILLLSGHTRLTDKQRGRQMETGDIFCRTLTLREIMHSGTNPLAYDREVKRKNQVGNAEYRKFFWF